MRKLRLKIEVKFRLGQREWSMLPDESMLSLPRRRSDVRNVAESVAAGEQRFDGTPDVTAAAPATPDSGDTRFAIKRFRSAASAAATALRQRRQRRRRADGAADAATLTRVPRRARAHPRAT